jgi:hypothetical protein
MRSLKSVSLTMLMPLILAASIVVASPWNKLTRLQIDETIRVPGAVLPPGKYVVKLADSLSNRHIVQFFNEDQSKIYSTVLAIPNKLDRDQISGDTQLVFYEGRGNEPPALRAWFYPGVTYGQEFVYPKSEATKIAGATNRVVPTMDDTAASSLRQRENPDQAPEFDSKTRVYGSSASGSESTIDEGYADSAKKDSDTKWREQQKTNKRYGRFMDDKSSSTNRSTTSNANTNNSSGTASKPSSTQSTNQQNNQASNQTNNQQNNSKIIVSRIIAVPDNLKQRSAEIKSVMSRVEQHGDAFAEQFKKALNSSTVAIADRDELKQMAENLEDRLDELTEDYKKEDFNSAHNHLRKALETGASINRFMLRSEFSDVENTWDALRNDLNSLAAAHTYPVLQIFTIRSAK